MRDLSVESPPADDVMGSNLETMNEWVSVLFNTRGNWALWGAWKVQAALMSVTRSNTFSTATDFPFSGHTTSKQNIHKRKTLYSTCIF